MSYKNCEITEERIMGGREGSATKLVEGASPEKRKLAFFEG